MIDVEMRDDQVIDTREPCDLGRHLTDARCAALVGVAGVDQNRLARGRHDERRGSSFDVDPVDLQRFGVLLLRRRGSDEQRNSEASNRASHIHDVRYFIAGGSMNVRILFPAP